MSVKNIKSTPAAKVKANNVKSFMLFDKTNYMLMGAGLLLIIIGYLLMAGGKSEDPKVFNAEELYSFRRITLAPILVLLGFVVEIYAIMRKPKSAE